MFAKKFAIVGLALGLLGLGSAAITLSPSASPPAAAGVILDESTGILPLHQVVEFLDRRADDRPADFVTRTELARALSDLGRQNADLDAYADAEQASRSALVIKPDYQPAQLELASALAAQHRFAESRELAQGVLAADPSSNEAVILAAGADLSVGRYDDAASGYNRLAAAKRTAPVVSGLARLASEQGDNELAVTLAAEALDLSRALTHRPNSAAFYHFQLGHFRFETGDVDGAIDELTEALAVDPNHIGATERLAFVHAAGGDLEQAAELYQRLIDSGPAADLHGSYAAVLTELGQTQAAAEQRRLGLALAEETADRHPAERRHLAGFYLTQDPAQALALAEADLLERQDAGAYDTVAWALYHLGRHDEASVAMARVLEVGTNTAAVHYHAGAIAAATGNHETAIDHLSTALDINPQFSSDGADHARALLSELQAQADR